MLLITLITLMLMMMAAVRCDMALHRALRARSVRKSSIGGEERHGVTSGVSCEISKTLNVTPHLHREYDHYRHCDHMISVVLLF